MMIVIFRRFPNRSLIAVLTYSKRGIFTIVPDKPRIIQPILNVSQNNLQHWRFKSQSGKNKKENLSGNESDESNDKDFVDDIQDKHTKILNINTSSMRLDLIVKSGLGISRNKIEVLFYESKIRLNGEKVLKKSTRIQERDEIDLIKGVSIHNPGFLTIARLEILSATPNEDNIAVKIRRCKSLTVENYKERNSWNP